MTRFALTCLSSDHGASHAESKVYRLHARLLARSYPPAQAGHLPLYRPGAKSNMAQVMPLVRKNQLAAGVALEDWDVLFGAVTMRLREAIAAAQQATGPDAHLNACVLECLEALEQLRATHNQAWAAQQASRGS